MLRVVIDTNVIVSGIISRKGAPAEILNAWRERHFLLFISPAIVAEVRSVLGYARIREKYTLSDQEIDQMISLLEHDAMLVPGIADVAGSLPADPQDEMFLACGVDEVADVIVSADDKILQFV